MPNSIYAGYVASYTARERISLTRYARVVGVSLGTVEKWMSGDITRPQPLHLIRLCRVHGIDPDRSEDLGFRPRAVQPGRTQRYTGPGMEDEHMATLLRRDLLGMTASTIYGATLAGPIAHLLDSVPAPDVRVGASDVARLRQAGHRITLGGDLLGSDAARVKKLLVEHKRAATLLHGTFATEALRQEAHAAAAIVTRQVGFEFYDSGMHDKARQLWLTSLAMTRQAEPAIALVIRTHVLENMAYQAMSLEQPQQALDLLHLLMQPRTIPPTQAALHANHDESPRLRRPRRNRRDSSIHRLRRRSLRRPHR